ncbi:MAG: hypothetical protein ABS36_16115 [Acidobacteria bacterium SCN 69-37]|nr:MAG: hypothetical protein ABS36_16115 [Acidobacteria bacterium SCN 69-37]
MLSVLKERFVEVARAVTPLIATVCILQVVVVHAPAADVLRFLAGSVLAVLGMMLLFIGIDIGILPMGRFIGAELPRKGSLVLILAVAFALGFATTVAEPDVLVLASQVEDASHGDVSARSLIYIIAVGVGTFAAIALLRVVRGFSMTTLLTVAYGLMLVLSFLTPPDLVPLAYDAGSVTTGVLTAPVILALAIGLSSVLAGRSAVSDGFGLLGFASIGAMIAVMVARFFL